MSFLVQTSFSYPENQTRPSDNGKDGVYDDFIDEGIAFRTAFRPRTTTGRSS